MSLQSQDPDELAHSSVLKDISKESLNLCKCTGMFSEVYMPGISSFSSFV